MRFQGLKLFSLLLASAMISFVACNKEELVKADQQAAADIALVDGRLKFASEEVLKNTIKALSAHQQKDELNKWEQQWPGFVSMRTAFDQITEQDIVKIATKGTQGYSGYLTLVGVGEDKEVVRNIDSPVLATLASKDGIILVGDNALKFHYDKLIKVKDFDETKLATLMSAKAANAAQGLESFEVKRVIIGSRSQPSASGREVNCIHDYWHGNSICCKKRLVGEIWASVYAYNSYLWEHIGGRTKHQKRTSGIWYGEGVQELRLVLTGELSTYDDDGLNFTGNYSINYDNTNYGSNIHEHSVIFNDLDGSRNPFNINSFSGYHSGTVANGSFKECYNYW
jgi:hypothetical protein